MLEINSLKNVEQLIPNCKKSKVPPFIVKIYQMLEV
jgi:hypothetical protein